MVIGMCDKPMFRSEIKVLYKETLATMTQVTVLGLSGGIKDSRFGGGLGHVSGDKSCLERGEENGNNPMDAAGSEMK